MYGVTTNGDRQFTIKTSHRKTLKQSSHPETYGLLGPFSSLPRQSLLMGRGKPFSATWFLEPSGSKLLGTWVLSHTVKQEHKAMSTQRGLLTLNATVKIA